MLFRVLVYIAFSVLTFTPAISVVRNSSGHAVGYTDFLYQQLLYLAQRLKFTYKISVIGENTNGIKRNGAWTGIIGTLLRESHSFTKMHSFSPYKEADFGLAPMAISLERYEAIEFCGPITGDSTGILVKYPEPIVSSTSAIEVFSTGVWIGWIVSAAAVVGISTVLTCTSKKLRIEAGETSAVSTKTFSWYLYGVLISQGSRLPSSPSPQKLLAATWCIVAFVFVNIYNSTLTSYMSVTYQRPTINSFSDLAASSTFKATVLTGSIQDIDLLRATTGVQKILADKIRKCSPDCRKFNLNEMFSLVLGDEPYVTIVPVTVGIAALKKHNLQREKCRLAMAHETMSWKPMFCAVPKTSPYIEEINRESLWFIDTALFDYWHAQYLKKPLQCRLNYNSKGVSTKTFKNRVVLKQFYLPFLILFCGYFLAFLQFLREKILFSFHF
ncbi:glutamate receptor 2-like isoform X1 [Daphnia carinata]|uniref:glutamate receptor 2-like isoform X1 n=1 Tax=Daphnia carinata TaxID=120202 RepID=UPI002580DBFC|nr:glutamate receptor 2-like isoform X1 [Daphnia carinata]